LVNQLFVFEGDGHIRLFNGNYSDYRDWVEEQESAPVQKTTVPLPAEKTKSSEKKKASFKDKQEYEKLQQEIESLEKKKSELTDRLNQGSADHQELQQWAIEIQQLTDQIDQKTTRWMELSEIVE